MDDTLRQILRQLFAYSEELEELRPKLAALEARVKELEGAAPPPEEPD